MTLIVTATYSSDNTLQNVIDDLINIDLLHTRSPWFKNKTGSGQELPGQC